MPKFFYGADCWVARWDDEEGVGKLMEWVEDHVEETLTVYRLPSGDLHIRTGLRSHWELQKILDTTSRGVRLASGRLAG